MFSKDTNFFLPLDYYEDLVDRVHSKHNLESYAYNLRNTLRKLEGVVYETINWLDASPKASKGEYEEKKAELEMIAKYVCFLFVDPQFSSPIIYRLYNVAGDSSGRFFFARPDGPGGQPGGFP